MLEQITRWFGQYETLWTGLGIASAAMFIFSLLLLPWMLCRIPEDYFCRPATPGHWLAPRTLFRNALGLPVLLAGILMLVLPGQGLLTIFLGLAVMDFPGKARLEQWLIGRRGVLTSVNWIRERAGYSPLLSHTPHGQKQT